MQNEALDILNSYTKKRVVEITQNTRTDEYKMLSSLLARCEHFSVGVSEGIYDKKILSKLSRGHFESLYDKLEPLIEKKRNIANNMNKTNPKIKHYSSFEKLAKELQLKRKFHFL